MAILNILKEGDPTLSKMARPVTEITERITTLLDDMADTMRRANGMGLAAPQVGVLRRVVPDFTRGSWNKVQGYKHADGPRGVPFRARKARHCHAPVVRQGARARP